MVKYEFNGNDIIFKHPDFDLEQTLDCGQAFRWKKTDTGIFSGFFLNKPLTISQCGDVFTLHNSTEDDFLKIWTEYFDLNTDYGELKRIFSQDETLKNACVFAPGIRLLKQDPWEALCSFIISQNNNIPRIKGIIDRMCEEFGEFPSPDQLASQTIESLTVIRSGFRSKYLIDAADKIASGLLNLDEIKHMPLQEARKALMTIKGVGPKVAECVLLFGMHRKEAFPVDVWIKRVMTEYYSDGFPEFAKENAGAAQQYLFHYIRHIEEVQQRKQEKEKVTIQ